MKTTHGRRWLALLLTLALCLGLAPAAFAALTGISLKLDKASLALVEDGEDVTLTATVSGVPEGEKLTNPNAITFSWESNDEDVVTVKEDTKTAENGVIISTATVTVTGGGTAAITVTATHSSMGSASATCTVTVEQEMIDVTISPTGPLVMEKGNSRGLSVTTLPENQPVTWTSSDESTATVDSRGTIYAKAPGETTITATIGSGSNKAFDTVKVEVSGIRLDKTSLTLKEQEDEELPEARRFGVASGKTVSWMSMDPDVAEIIDGRVLGVGPGRTTIEASVDGGVYRATANVEVTVGATTIDRRNSPMSVTDTLSFKTLGSSFENQGGEGGLSHITGLRVDTAQGTLYYKYYSEAEPGSGVAQEASYYLEAGSGRRLLSDITFVPKPNFTGGTVTISYTAVSKQYQNQQCRILLTVEPRGSVPTVSLSTPYDTPIKLSSAEFDRICQELNGVGLNTVTFAQPSSRQGTLYTNYVSSGNYGSPVSTSKMYTRQELDDIWFVPAPGVSGPVTISYTARGRGSTGSVYTGSLTITVGDRSDVKEGGPIYTTANGGPVNFDDWDFENYRTQVLSGGNTLSCIQFDSLPAASQGVLYYDYRNSSSPGSRVSSGTNYYYGTRTPRLDRITFVPADSFTGTVRVPFTGWDRDGRSFSGQVEIAVRGGGGSGDIRYTCSPGRSVSFLNSDFTSLCRELTDRTLNYIVLQGLPDRYSEGSIYHSSSRVSSTGTRYYANTSSSYRISRLSFEASSGFFGSVDIPFVGYASNGDSFDGVITVSSSGVDDWTIHYRTDSGTAAVFDRDDFDSLSQWDTRENVRSVRFQVPSASQGDLYRNYRSSSNRGTRISSSSTSISRSSLDQVAFVPARGYTGTVYIDFTATSDNGSVFDGTVEIAVGRDAWYEPDPTPVNFYDVAADAYYAEPVRWAVENGITSGTSSTTFSPYQTCTVAQILSFLYRANGSPRVTGSNPFTDVRTSDYYYEAALWAYQNGLVSGSALRPFAPCTRASTMEYMWKAAGSPAVSYSSRYDDVAANASYARAVAWATQQKITSGTSKTTFSPNNICTRGQIVSFLYRAMGW